MTVLIRERAPDVASPPRKTPMTALSVPVAVRDAVNRVALQLSADLGRRVSMGAVVEAALEITSEDMGRLRDVLSRQAAGEGVQE